MPISVLVSDKLRVMSLFCAFLVLFIHIGVDTQHPGPWIVRAFFSHGLGKIAVPFFFVAAGYLLAGHFRDEQWYRREVVKRMKTLLVPLILWCLAWYLYGIGMTVCCNVVKGRSVITNIHAPSAIDLMRMFAIYPFSQPYLGVLWFVRTLFVLVLLSPILLKIAHPATVACLLVVNGLVHPDYGVQCTPVIFTLQEGFLSCFGAAFFMAGILLRKRNVDLDLSWKVGLPCLGVGLLLLLIRGFPYQDLLARRLTWAYIPFLLTGVWWLCPALKTPSWLANASFPVYAFHMFAMSIIGFLCKVTKTTWLTGPDCTTMGYVLFGVLSFALCIAFAAGLRRFAPRIAKVTFGGR